MRRRLLPASVLLACALGRAEEPRGAFEDLARLGIIDPRTGTPQALDAELALGEQALERGDFAAAAASLHGIVHSPRYADFSDTVAYQNAEYGLLVALAGGGAAGEALAVAERVLLRGPAAPYFAVAHRRAVDVALQTRAYRPVLARLEAVKLDQPLPTEALAERAYLRGRAAYDEGKLDDAERELAQVSRRSRLFSSAVYLRGVLAVRQGKLGGATEAFCEIAGNPDGDRYSFVVDDRYFALKDLARLGAARVAHEEGRFDDAYYHYFQIPDDSDRLPEALFEAGWSMYQKRELRTARDLVKELLTSFPTAPQVPEALLLAGYIELADCRFPEARARFDALSKELRPLVAVVERLRGSPADRQALLGRALARAGRRGPAAQLPPLTSAPEDRVLAMLRLDPRLLRLSDTVSGLRTEAALAPGAIAAWRDLLGRLPGTQVQPVPPEGVTLLARVRQLRAELRRERPGAGDRLPELDGADARLAAIEARLAGSGAAGGDPALRARVAADLEKTEGLAARAAELAGTFDRAADALAAKELLRLHHQLVRIFEKARLGTIDAVIGEKRMYEKEIEDIAADRFLPRQAGKVHEHGLISDTEEYWPPEEEVWEDEYEAWK
jgi:tetratricopeptide (TPR) repeat protein